MVRSISVAALLSAFAGFLVFAQVSEKDKADFLKAQRNALIAKESYQKAAQEVIDKQKDLMLVCSKAGKIFVDTTASCAEVKDLPKGPPPRAGSTQQDNTTKKP
jgi:hypothetical protein